MEDNDFIPTPTIGEILREEFLNPLNLTAYRLAKDLNVSTTTILDLVHGKRRLSVDIALRLSKYFGTSSKFWLNIQNEIDIQNMTHALNSELDKIPSIAHRAS